MGQRFALQVVNIFAINLLQLLTEIQAYTWLLDCFNHFRETFQAINTSDEDVGYLQKLLSSTKKVKIFYVIN